MPVSPYNPAATFYQATLEDAIHHHLHESNSYTACRQGAIDWYYGIRRWIQITRSQYWDMLECLMPQILEPRFFLCSEQWNDGLYYAGLSKAEEATGGIDTYWMMLMSPAEAKARKSFPFAVELPVFTKEVRPFVPQPATT